jgi:hypothetical protein
MGIKIRKRIHQGQEKPYQNQENHPKVKKKKNIMIKKNSSKPREPHKGTILRTQVTTKNKNNTNIVIVRYAENTQQKKTLIRTNYHTVLKKIEKVTGLR